MADEELKLAAWQIEKAELTARVEGLEAERDHYRLALAECKARLQQFAADTTEGFDCLPSCDSIAHDTMCPVAHPVEAWRILRERLAECEREKAGIRAALEGARVLIAALTEASEGKK